MGSACAAGQSQASFEEAFPQARWLSRHLLWGDEQSLGCLMAMSSATHWGPWPRCLLLQQKPSPCTVSSQTSYRNSLPVDTAVVFPWPHCFLKPAGI